MIGPDKYAAVLLVAVTLWTACSVLTFGYSLHGAIQVNRDLRRLRRSGQNGSALVVARWLRRHHILLFLLGAVEVTLWLLLFTGAMIAIPSQRGVLFALGQAAVNVTTALIAVGSLNERRALQRRIVLEDRG